MTRQRERESERERRAGTGTDGDARRDGGAHGHTDGETGMRAWRGGRGRDAHTYAHTHGQGHARTRAQTDRGDVSVNLDFSDSAGGEQSGPSYNQCTV